MNNLTKREFLETGYVNNFINQEGERKSILCTKEEYESNSVPVLPGWDFLSAQGGVLVVNTGLLKPNEYTIVDGKYFVCTSNEFGESVKEYSEEEFNNL